MCIQSGAFAVPVENELQAQNLKLIIESTKPLSTVSHFSRAAVYSEPTGCPTEKSRHLLPDVPPHPKRSDRVEYM